jgi:ABC-type uncharacterized transport system permease subunit
MALTSLMLLQAQPALLGVALVIFAVGFGLMLTVGPLGGVILRIALIRRLLGGTSASDEGRGSVESLVIIIGVMAVTWTLFILFPDEMVFGLICLSAVSLAVYRIK